MLKKALTPIVLAAAFVAAGVLAPAAVLAQQP